MNKKKLMIIICFVAVIFAVIAAVGFALSVASDDLGGVTDISVKKKNAHELELEFSYAFPTGGYSVSNLNDDDGEYSGDGKREYDGSLGKYRIMVRFGDVRPSKKLKGKLLGADYLVRGYFELKSGGITMRGRIRYPSADHGFVLYLGSDTPISVSEESGELNKAGGTLKIPVTLGDE